MVQARFRDAGACINLHESKQGRALGTPSLSRELSSSIFTRLFGVSANLREDRFNERPRHVRDEL